jgi:hypothetical protein
MKKTATKPTTPVIVPIEAKGLKKDYALTHGQTQKALAKLSRLHSERKALRKVTRVKGKFSPGYFD